MSIPFNIWSYVLLFILSNLFSSLLPKLVTNVLHALAPFTNSKCITLCKNKELHELSHTIFYVTFLATFKTFYFSKCKLSWKKSETKILTYPMHIPDELKIWALREGVGSLIWLCPLLLQLKKLLIPPNLVTHERKFFEIPARNLSAFKRWRV